jgi:hypothetical protein
MAPSVVLGALRGENRRLPPLSLPLDQAVSCVNVDLNDIGLARRRKGSTSLDETDVEQIHWFDGELWALKANGDLVRDLLGTPSTLDTGVTGPLAFQELHGKLYIGGLDGERLSVWDGSDLRLTGLAEPAAPTAADSGGAGGFIGVRYYRVRYLDWDGSVNDPVRRSEPSETLTFTPSGTNASVTITKPAAINEGETHWQLEASIDNANFWVLATTVVGTTTAVDSVAFSAGYQTVVGATLSEPIGSYSLIPDGTRLEANHDRLIIATGSRIYWTPNALDPGSGDDERIDSTRDPFLDLDTDLGGDITALSSPAHDYVWIFKTEGVYQLVRTGVSTRAYRADLLTRFRGAVAGSVVTAIDADGYPAVFFVDPRVGPHIISRQGIQWIGADHERSFDWSTVVGAVFDRDRRLIIWSTGEASRVLHLDKLDIASRGGGWVRWTHPDTVSFATSSTAVLAGGEDGVRQLQADVTTDAGTAFEASIEFRPLTGEALTGRFGIMNGALVTSGDEQALNVSLRMNFGSTDEYTNDVTCAANDRVVDLDSLSLNDAETIHLLVGDAASVTEWAIDQFHLKLTGGAQ